MLSGIAAVLVAAIVTIVAPVGVVVPKADGVVVPTTALATNA